MVYVPWSRVHCQLGGAREKISFIFLWWNDLMAMRQKANESALEYLKRFREVRNLCYSVKLPDEQIASMAWAGLIPSIKQATMGQEFDNLSHLA